MKKRNMLTIMLVAILVFVLGLGTIAYYKKTFSSNNNLVRAAKFEVDSNGTLNEDVEFDLRDTPIYPGFEDDIYEFEIDKKGTEVPVKYDVTVTASGELFEPFGETASPVVMTLYRETENGWEKVDNPCEINPVENQVEYFKIGLNWNHSDYDIEYQNKTGKIAINVVAEQVDEEPEVPEEPSIVRLVDPAPITVAVGDSVTMPATVVANMSDGTTKDVPVTWMPDRIDTSTAGTKIAVGTVEGFEDKAKFVVTVEEVRPQLTAWYFKWGASTYLVVENVQLEGAVNYKVIIDGKKLANIQKIGKAISVNPEGGTINSFGLEIYDNSGVPGPGGKPHKLLWEGVVNNPEFKGTKNPTPYL